MTTTAPESGASSCSRDLLAGQRRPFPSSKSRGDSIPAGNRPFGGLSFARLLVMLMVDVRAGSAALATNGRTLSLVPVEPAAIVTIWVVLPPVASTSAVPTVVWPRVLSTVIDV